MSRKLWHLFESKGGSPAGSENSINVAHTVDKNLNKTSSSAFSMKKFKANKQQYLKRSMTIRNYAHAYYDGALKVGVNTIHRLPPRPYCFTLLLIAYHKYGLKHLILLLILFMYAIFGAFIFYIIEEPNQEQEKYLWNLEIMGNRSTFVANLMKDLFNNSHNLVFIPEKTSDQLSKHMLKSMALYERSLGVKWTDMKIEWNFPNAMLFALTVFTTIGYGHIYPRTNAGKVLTMIYSIGGIPLVLLVLQDLGRLLTVSLKFPWLQLKKVIRRLIRVCTEQSIDEILKIEMKEKENLAIFDLPIPVAVVLVVGWIFLCSATLCIWETDWSYLEAFYFFFISLSTIGLGDMAPSQPSLLLMMFGYIIVGLSLVSMCVNLIQIKLEKTYQAGQTEVNCISNSVFSAIHSNSEEGTLHTREPIHTFARVSMPCGVLGIFQSRSFNCVPSEVAKSYQSLGSFKNVTQQRSVCTQTPFCFQSPNRSAVRRVIVSDTGDSLHLTTNNIYDDQGSDVQRHSISSPVINALNQQYVSMDKEWFKCVSNDY